MRGVGVVLFVVGIVADLIETSRPFPNALVLGVGFCLWLVGLVLIGPRDVLADHPEERS